MAKLGVPGQGPQGGRSAMTRFDLLDEYTTTLAPQYQPRGGPLAYERSHGPALTSMVVLALGCLLLLASLQGNSSEPEPAAQALTQP